MKKYLLFLVFCLGVFSASEWYKDTQLRTLRREFQANIYSINIDQNDWHRRIKVSNDGKNFTSDLYIEGGGLSSVGIFHAKGKLLDFNEGQFIYSINRTTTQNAFIKDLDHADLYTKNLNYTIENKQLKFKPIYSDENIIVINNSTYNESFLYVRKK